MFQTNDGPAINTYAWDYILLKNFPKAVQILEKGLLLLNKSQEIYPFLLINLAHAYLLTNQFEKAHAIYFENLKMKLNDKSWESIIHEDFKDFKKRGIYTPQMEQIEEELLVINAKYEKDRLLSLENQQSKEEAEEQRKIEQRIKSEKKEKRIRTFNKIISIGVKN